MTMLSDAQLVVFSAACQRPDRNVLPLPERIKGGAAHKIITSLLGKQLIEEVAAGPSEPVWRDSEDDSRTTLRATVAAFRALGIELEEDVAAGKEQGGGRPLNGGSAVDAVSDQQADRPHSRPPAATGRMPVPVSPPQPTPCPGAPRPGRTPSRRSSSPCCKGRMGPASTRSSPRQAGRPTPSAARSPERSRRGSA